MAFGGLALEPGDNHDIPTVQELVHFFGGDVLDLGLRMHAVRDDPGLGPGQGNGRDVNRVHGDGRERDGGLLAGSQEDIHLPLAGQGHDLPGEFDQIIRNPAHGGDHHDHLIAFGTVAGDAGGDILDPIGVSDRRAAIFLNN